MALMGFREYARHRAVSLRAVQKAVEAGRIATVGEGRDRKIDADQADRAWTSNTDPARQSVLHSAGPQRRPPPRDGRSTALENDPDDDPPPTGATDEDTAVYRAERAKREGIRREREQLALQQERNELVAVQEVARLQFTAMRLTRDRVEMVPARVAADLLTLAHSGGDAFAVERLLAQQLRQALDDAARAIEDIDDDEDPPD
jgi:hypothetical protein